MKKILYLIYISAILLVLACQPDRRHTAGAVTEADTTTLRLLLDTATTSFQQGDYRTSLATSQQAQVLARELGDTISLGDALSCKLCCYQQLGMQDSAIHTSRELLAIDEAAGDIEALSGDYNNLTSIYLTSNQPDLAYELIEKAIALEKKVDGQPHLSIRYGIASEVLNKMSDDSTRADHTQLRKKALEYVDMALRLDEAKGDSLLMGRRLSQRADVLIGMGRQQEAKDDYLKAISLLEAKGERHSLAITYRQLGTLYLKADDKQTAIRLYEKALPIIEQEGELITLMKDYEQLHTAYHGIDDNKANHYLKLYTQLKDSIYTMESARSLSEFHARYDINKEKQNALRHKQHFILTLVLSIIGSVLFTLIVCWLFFTNYRRKSKNKQLREEIKTIKQEMSDQQAIYLEHIKQKEEALCTDMSIQDKQFLEKLNNIIFNLMADQELTTENIAHHLCMTSQQLRRRIKATCTLTSKAYITQVRIGYAKQLLHDRPDLTIEQIGALCGFDEATHFARSFKKETGTTPSRFRGE